MSNEKGFTLIEIMCVLVLIGIIGTVAYKLIDFSGSAAEKAAVHYIAQLNQLEKHAWLNCKLDSNCAPDSLLPDTDPDFLITRSPNGDGVGLTGSGTDYTYIIKNKEFVLVYTPPTAGEPAKWKLLE